MKLQDKLSLYYPGFSLAACFLIAINHVIGIIGLNDPSYQRLFENLAYINLLLSFALVMVFHSPINKGLVFFCMTSFVIGMTAEIIGVNTGYPFGKYYYTQAFGVQLYQVPVIIGVNWILLSYVSGMAMNNYFTRSSQRIIAASLLMVAIDILLESFATRHHFWVWQRGSPPLQNYFAWFLVSLPIQFIFQQLVSVASNIQSLRYLVILTCFLAIDLAVRALG